MTDNPQITGRKIEDKIWMAPDRKPNPKNDAFSGTISDSEREIILSAPTPIIIQAIEETIIESEHDEFTRNVGRKAIQTALKQGIIPKVVQNFFDRINNTDEPDDLAPYVDGGEREYLSIICAFINGARSLNKTEPETVSAISEKFGDKAYAKLLSSPDADVGKKSVFVIVNNFDKDPDY